MTEQRASRRRATSPLPQPHVCIDFAVLGDFAQAVAGKLTIVGAGWNIINAKQYPQTVPFGLGIGILIPWAETNVKHPFTFSIEDGDGSQLLSGGGEVEAGRQPGTPPGLDQRIVLGLSGQMQLAKPGSYVIRVSAAGDEKRITFEALPVQRP